MTISNITIETLNTLNRATFEVKDKKHTLNFRYFREEVEFYSYTQEIKFGSILENMFEDYKTLQDTVKKAYLEYVANNKKRTCFADIK